MNISYSKFVLLKLETKIFIHAWPRLIISSTTSSDEAKEGSVQKFDSPSHNIIFS